MDTTNADRQRRFRERRQQDHTALLDKLAALESRVAQLEAELATRPQQPARQPPARQSAGDAALKRERDELAERLQQIENYRPGITAKAQAWIAEVDRRTDADGKRRTKPGGGSRATRFRVS